MAVTGKTGADAIAKALKKICQMIVKFGPKLDAVIDAAESAGVITLTQATVAHAFVSSAQAACDIFTLIAGYSGF